MQGASPARCMWALWALGVAQQGRGGPLGLGAVNKGRASSCGGGWATGRCSR